ncbi:MAG: T9SS type A sorting domain-containing protein [Crocinitomicaceae bacterium]|nr:T9SS type A sorting domain-containing protein [Crocinitomicaceae bacterium]
MRSLALIVAFLPFLGFGQIFLDQSDFANAGDTIRMSSATDAAIDFSSTGANWSWDYSSLIAESQDLRGFFDLSNASALVNIIYGTFAGPDHQASYFSANDDLPLDQLGGILPVNITNVFQFSKSSSSAITSVGIAMAVEGTEIPFKSDTIETRYELPLMYQNTYNSRGYTKMDLNPIQDIVWIQYRTRDSEVDGWGSVTTPYGTFEALRVKHTITELDSITMNIFGGPITIPLPIPDSYIYEWWADGQMEPVLRIETSNFGGTETVSGIEFRDDFDPALVGIIDKSIEVKVYPNPVIDELKVVGMEPGATYAIIDAVGSNVNKGVLNASESIDVSALSNGTYSIVILSGGKLTQYSFIK